MAFRGWMALNGVEIVNSSRVVSHLGRETPTSDDDVFVDTPSGYTLVEDPPGSGLYADCSLKEDSPLLYGIPESAVPYRPPSVFPYEFPVTMGSAGLWYPPNGARRFGPGLYTVDTCWNVAAICGGCTLNVQWDDSWPGLPGFLRDGNTYRPELAPWYVSELPESGEFAGVWLMDVTGLDATRIERSVTETVGDGGVAGPHRDATRMVTFDALLIGCTNAGVDYGLKWLSCLLRDTADNVTTKLRYLAAHPGHSAVDAESLVREVSGVVLTSAPEIKESFVTGASQNRQANIYRITWEMAVLHPHAYLPEVAIDVDWDRVTRQPINWIHAADCSVPETCEDMPVMFSTECEPEELTVVNTPPPTCGGCLPVSAIDKYSFMVPTQDYAFRCRDTAVSLTITNTGEESLSLQAFWRICGTDVRCEDNQWPLQVSGLPAGAELHLDGKSGRFWAWYDERIRRPVGVVGTPNGAPWRPPRIDRTQCWDFIVRAASTAEFTVSMSLADREP